VTLYDMLLDLVVTWDKPGVSALFPAQNKNVVRGFSLALYCTTLKGRIQYKDNPLIISALQSMQGMKLAKYVYWCYPCGQPVHGLDFSC
jgi:hypothetical protein